MADTKTAAKKPAKNVWTDEERAAMQASAHERKSRAKLSPEDERSAGLQDIKDSLAKLPDDDRELGQRLHEVITEAAPQLMPRTYYGMPAYATGGKTVCFFKAKSKFKERYSTLGFESIAELDDGDMWPVAFAVAELTPAVEARIAQLVKKAAG